MADAFIATRLGEGGGTETTGDAGAQAKPATPPPASRVDLALR